jgi:hypothetical protein
VPDVSTVEHCFVTQPFQRRQLVKAEQWPVAYVKNFDFPWARAAEKKPVRVTVSLHVKTLQKNIGKRKGELSHNSQTNVKENRCRGTD